VPASDLYSLGVILYEMLVGKVPFDDPSPTAVALQHLTSMPPTPRQINPNLNPQVETVLLKALSKAPEDRYATGQELLDALEQALLPQDAANVKESADSIAAVEALFESNAEDTPSGEVSQIKISKDIPADASPTLAPPSPVDEADDMIGQQFDEYRLEALLGHGGMARVYRALDVGLNRYVAIKVIDAPFRSDSDAAARFEREAQAIAQLEHPHIVHLYRYGEANDMLYMAMQYIEGADLETVLDTYHDDDQLMPPEEIVRVTREICEALDHAHSKDVIHRDIKPSNVMLTPEGSAILTDFGLALLTEYGTKGEIFGSPYYIAPEQAISSAKVVPQSDFYAVGCMLYEMVTGQVPFDADTAVDVAMLHMSEPPKSPRELRADLGEEMEAIILKLLAKDPADRYPDGASIADAVEEAMQTETPAEKSKKISHDSIPVRVAAELAENPLPPIPSPSPQTADAPPPKPPSKKAGEKKQSLPPIPAAVAMRASLPTRRMEEPEPEREPESPQPAEAQKPKPTAAEAAKSSKKKNDKWPLILFTVIVVGIMLGVLIVAGIMVAVYFANGGKIF
jgi:serine/threonine-protein kinase